MAVTLSPLFLKHLMEQISVLYAMKLFIMKSVNCLVFKMEIVFSRLQRKSIQSISQNYLNFQL